MSDNPYSMLRSDSSDEVNVTEDAAAAAGAHETAASDGPGAPGYKPRTSRANAILAAMFVAAGATVYGLSLRKGPAEASARQKAIEVQVDTALNRISLDSQAPAGARTPGGMSDPLLQQFYDQVSRRQVPLKDLKKNPFAFAPPPVVQPAAPPETARLPDAEPPDPKAQSRREALAKLKGLRLQAIQRSGGRAAAIISNDLITEGQTIECFTVKRIDQKAVVLTWQQEEFVLEMP